MASLVSLPPSFRLPRRTLPRTLNRTPEVPRLGSPSPSCGTGPGHSPGQRRTRACHVSCSTSGAASSLSSRCRHQSFQGRTGTSQNHHYLRREWGCHVSLSTSSSEHEAEESDSEASNPTTTSRQNSPTSPLPISADGTPTESHLPEASASTGLPSPRRSSDGDVSSEHEAQQMQVQVQDGQQAQAQAQGQTQETGAGVMRAWIPPPPSSQLPGSTSGSMGNPSYYPQGFEWMDQGEQLLTWQNGLILAAAVALLVWKFQWLATEMALTALGIASGIVAILSLIPAAATFLVLHLVSKLPEPILDKILDATVTAATGATAAVDLASALLDLMPLQPVIASLAGVYLVLTLHETANPKAWIADLSLGAVGVASVGYSLGVVTGSQLLVALGGGVAFSAALFFLKGRGEEGSSAQPGKVTVPAGSSGTLSALEPDSGSSPLTASGPVSLILTLATPAVICLVCVAGNTLVQLAAAALYAAAVVLAGSSRQAGAAGSLAALVGGIQWGAPFQRKGLSPFLLLRVAVGYTAVAAARRLAFALYLKAHGL